MNQLLASMPFIKSDLLFYQNFRIWHVGLLSPKYLGQP